MGYVLQPTTSFTVLDGRAIFLDLATDRYLSLRPAQENALRALMGTNSADDSWHEAVTALVSSGILAQVDSDTSIQPVMHVAAEHSILDANVVKARMWQILLALRQLRATKIELRTGSLFASIGKLRRLKAIHRARPRRRGDIAGITSAFQATTLLMSPHKQCLPRSLALATFLARLGHECDLMFGVATNPFSAHCWVQQQDLVLNDYVEKVAGYTPILVT